MKTLTAGIVGLILGTIVGTLAAVAFGRHDDEPRTWWLHV